MASNPTKFLDTGIPGLDQVLGGGLCERGMLLVFGPPGAGKTTMVFQMALHAAWSVVYRSIVRPLGR